MEVLYDVINSDLNIAIVRKRNVRALHILFGVEPCEIRAAAACGKEICGKYYIRKSELEKVENAEEMRLVLKNWEKLTEPFRRVIWCKHMADGVRRLEA